jgi:glycine hydroxymethyltransferase
VTLRNLRDPKEGADMRVDIALQGPKSREVLMALGVDEKNRKKIMALKRTQLCEAQVGEIELVVSRTGYTGEKMAFELFVHPDQAPALWTRLLEAGASFGIKPCGLGARDSLRTEAGLPLYGHEMGGEKNLGVAEAGFGSYVKIYKPWFIGRDAYIAREKQRTHEVARFHFGEKGVRMTHPGDSVLDGEGREIGYVTSCAIDSQGLLTGQAFIERGLAKDGTPIFVHQSSLKKAGKPPTPASVVSRFPKTG